MEVLKCWIMLEVQKISIKMKNCKSFLWGPNSQLPQGNYSASPQSPTHPPSDKILLRLWKKNIWRYTEIYRHLIWKCFKNAVLWGQEMVQPKCFFWHQTETCLLENWVRFFEGNCIVKWVIFFSSFCWLCNFLQENLKIEKKLWWCPLEHVGEYKSVACPW